MSALFPLGVVYNVAGRWPAGREFNGYWSVSLNFKSVAGTDRRFSSFPPFRRLQCRRQSHLGDTSSSQFWSFLVYRRCQLNGISTIKSQPKGFYETDFQRYVVIPLNDNLPVKDRLNSNYFSKFSLSNLELLQG